MVQAVSLQGRDRHDDGMDVVAGTQVRNFFQCAAHRDTMDGLAQLVGVIIHGHDDMAVAGVGLADIDGPRTSLARTHDHDRAVGVLAGVAAQTLAQRVVQEEPPCQTAPADEQENEHRRHGVGRVEKHAVDEAAVDQIDDARRDGDHPGQTDEVTLPGVLPKDGVEPPGQKAEQVDCHDPGQIRVEQGAVMGPPGGLDSAVCAQQQGEIKAEGYDGSVQRHQQSPAGQYLQQICFLFLHSISSFASGAGIRRCQLPFFISRAYHPIISLVLYSILSPVSSYFTFWTFFLCRLSPAATARSSSPRPSGHAAAKQTAAIPAPPSATAASCKGAPPVSQSAKRCRRASPAPALTAPAKPGAPSHRQSCSRRPQLDSSRPVLAVHV